jgi:hypothetical protein
MFTPDEVAGIVDLFGLLTREEAETAIAELAYRRGQEPPEEAVNDALSSFALVGVDRDGERFLAPGPAAFPTFPDGAEDLPHILDLDDRSVDTDRRVDAATARLRTEAVCAVTVGDAERATELIDISYDLEAWGDRDLSGIRAFLDAA